MRRRSPQPKRCHEFVVLSEDLVGFLQLLGHGFLQLLGLGGVNAAVDCIAGLVGVPVEPSDCAT